LDLVSPWRFYLRFQAHSMEPRSCSSCSSSRGGWFLGVIQPILLLQVFWQGLALYWPRRPQVLGGTRRDPARTGDNLQTGRDRRTRVAALAQAAARCHRWWVLQLAQFQFNLEQH
jgi:hypothetical protein